MHKCIMIKVGGNEIHIKYIKSRGEIIIFAKQEGKCTETGKTGGKFEICGG